MPLADGLPVVTMTPKFSAFPPIPPWGRVERIVEQLKWHPVILGVSYDGDSQVHRESRDCHLDR